MLIAVISTAASLCHRISSSSISPWTILFSQSIFPFPHSSLGVPTLPLSSVTMAMPGAIRRLLLSSSFRLCHRFLSLFQRRKQRRKGEERRSRRIVPDMAIATDDDGNVGEAEGNGTMDWAVWIDGADDG
jgi:hypothetical protein